MIAIFLNYYAIKDIGLGSAALQKCFQPPINGYIVQLESLHIEWVGKSNEDIKVSYPKGYFIFNHLIQNPMELLLL